MDFKFMESFMTTSLPFMTIIIIVATSYISYLGFKDYDFINKYKFQTESILGYKEYYRLTSSAFIHGDLGHLLFNMISFYSFSKGIEAVYGIHFVIIIYFVSIAGGSLLTLYIHKIHPEYSAIGASGGVSGIIFASIFLLPGGSIQLFFIPLPIPVYIYAVLYVLVSIYGIKTSVGNICHEAHLGGAMAGMIILLLLSPVSINTNIILFLVLTGINLLFFFYLTKNPVYMPIKTKDLSLKKVFKNTQKEKHKKQAAKNKDKVMGEIHQLFEKAKNESPDN